jgi:cellobiose phosphorylase
MTPKPIHSWIFTSPDGNFTLLDPHHTSYLYFPLVNEAGMMSAVTPTLHGDAKTSQHSFLLPPVSVEDLHASRFNRNFWVSINNDVDAWSATGNSALQIASNEDAVTLEAGFMWQKITRENTRIGLRAVITSFVPSTPDQVELMKVTFSNISAHPLSLTPTAAIPLYGRSADNLRDHRNVTSMLQRTQCERYGISVKPTLSFDERGHLPNNLTYVVLGVEGDGTAPVGFIPVMEDFIGEGGSFDWPEAIIHAEKSLSQVGTAVDGYETLGGLRFRTVVMQPGESNSYVVILAVLNEGVDSSHLINTYASSAQFNIYLEQTVAYWQSRLAVLAFQTGDPQFNAWLRWVTIQPILRRLYGNSFLPYHDYGRGGRGWRDLWQDILALLLMDIGSVDNLLIGNFGGVRLDGSNATIIGNLPGDFKADRNNIPRVWMDHGAWPLITTRLYIDQTGDLDFLLRQQSYFKDSHTNRCTGNDTSWDVSQGTEQRTRDSLVYYGSIYEHLLVQHLTAFFNVGEHNNILLEGADWNDGMDMARQKGESVAFTSLFASNLRQLSRMALELHTHGVIELELADELLLLLDTLNQLLNYDSSAEKRARLAEYFNKVQHTISGQKTRIAAIHLASDLQIKADWLTTHIRTDEWVQNSEGYGWFNGYYDNDGIRVEGDYPNGVRMTLTGQVFPMMGDVATDEQALQQVRSANRYLYDPKLRGYRLNTNFGEVKLNMGRCFGYAFGHKENGAMFSHMAVMYAYALYGRGFVREGFQVLDGIYRQSIDFPASRMYPGIPEYFNNRGRGMYPYLTGSASWYLLTLVTRVFGIYGVLGDLAIEPKLVSEQFNLDGNAGLSTLFAGRVLEIIYKNPMKLEYGEYRVGKITLDGMPVTRSDHSGITILSRAVITALDDARSHQLEIELDKS